MQNSLKKTNRQEKMDHCDREKDRGRKTSKNQPTKAQETQTHTTTYTHKERKD